jgi:hypothetical protein
MPSSFKNQTITNKQNKENKMKKVLLSLLTIALAFTAIAPAQAQDQKVLAIIDTAINSNNFPSIIHEVCFTTVRNMSCPNGGFFMEGKGAASAPWPKNINSGTFHGDTMVKAALVTDPNIKIVFLRVFNVSALGDSLTPSNGQTIFNAVKWVNDNAAKYSIDAVSISMSGIHTDLNTRAQSLHIGCRDASILNPFAEQVSQLNAKNVPTFVATGNDGSNLIVGFPSCVPGVIGVGALTSVVDAGTAVGETATNRGPGLDMVAISKISVTKYNGSVTDTSGSSASTVATSARYVGKNTFKTFTEYLNALPKQPVKFLSRDAQGNRVWEPAQVVPYNLP